jgi:hypothetical protein
MKTLVLVASANAALPCVALGLQTPGQGGIAVAPLSTPKDLAHGAAMSIARGPFRDTDLAKTFGDAQLPAERGMAADGLGFTTLGCSVSGRSGALPPLTVWMPSCTRHLRQLTAEVDGSYTDVQLEQVLAHECWYAKKFPRSCDSGFEEAKHCDAFAKLVVAARDEELANGSRKGYEKCCEHYYHLIGGAADIKKKRNKAPMFTHRTMPAVSTTLHCIINLTMQYFGLYTALAIVRTLISFKFELAGVQSILETACTTVTYAPMLCVLFLGARMRAIQLSQGNTEKYQLPQPWVQTAMIVASTAVFAQVVLVLLVGFSAGIGNVSTDKDGNLDVTGLESAHPLLVKLFTILRYVVMAMLYGGFTLVVVGIFLMKPPKEIWGDQRIPVSPAVMCTILLSGLFFLVYLLNAIVRTCFELDASSWDSPALLKLQASATTAKMTVNFAPMLCILFIGARMRALQIDPKHGQPQTWAQKSMFMCTFTILIQAVLVIVMPFLAKGSCKRGACEGDISFEMGNKAAGAVMTVIRYLFMLTLYGGIAVVVYSIYVIRAADPSKTPPVSPSMQCVITLTVQYFLIYCMLFICNTIKSFASRRGSRSTDEEAAAYGNQASQEEPSSERQQRGISKAIAIFEAARGTVMFAPMLAILFIGARMRALQLTKAKDGTIPPNAGPQKWVQDAMFLATWAIFVQLVMAMLVPILTGAAKPEPELDEDGVSKIGEQGVRAPPNTPKMIAVVVEVVRYFSLVCMYGGAAVVVYGVLVMTPDDLPPYSERGLVPGVDVPKPPVPVEAKL